MVIIDFFYGYVQRGLGVASLWRTQKTPLVGLAVSVHVRTHAIRNAQGANWSIYTYRSHWIFVFRKSQAMVFSGLLSHFDSHKTSLPIFILDSIDYVDD
jgi:hypothetical protein